MRRNTALRLAERELDLIEIAAEAAGVTRSEILRQGGLALARRIIGGDIERRPSFREAMVEKAGAS